MVSYTLQVTTTADTMSQSAWFVYMRQASNWYPLPGGGSPNQSEYRVFWNFSNKVNFYIERTTGTGEIYNNIKIIRIYANSNLPGGRNTGPLPGIDFKNYNAVCRYYQLGE